MNRKTLTAITELKKKDKKQANRIFFFNEIRVVGHSHRDLFRVCKVNNYNNPHAKENERIEKSVNMRHGECYSVIVFLIIIAKYCIDFSR